MEYNTVELIKNYEENEAGYCIYEVKLDGIVYYAAKSKLGTWKVCSTEEINFSTRQVRVPIEGKNCALQFISILDRMVGDGMNQWRGPLPKILGPAF